MASDKVGGMKQLRIVALAIIFASGWLRPAHAQISVKACAVLTAHRTGLQAAGGNTKASMDTSRIQAALSMCGPGQAVILEKSGNADAFASGPLLLPRGVTLFVSRNVTLFASRNPRDYDLRPQSCGVTATKQPGCKPFLYAYQAAFSGIAGEGTIDGQAEKVLQGSSKTWWDLRKQSKAPEHEGNAQGVVPDLIASYESQSFSVRGVHLKNAAGDSVAMYKTIGVRVEDLTIDSANGGDAVLLSNSPDAKVSEVETHVSGAALDLRASILGGTARVDATDLNVNGGTGIAIGDSLYGDVHTIHIENAFLQDAGFAFDLRGSQGGHVRDVQLKSTCISGGATPLEVQSSSGTANVLPTDQDVSFDGVSVSGRGSLKADGLHASGGASCAAMPPLPSLQWAVDTSMLAHPGTHAKLVVAQDGSGDYRTIQEAIDALPRTGGDISVKPGVYREVVTIRKPHVHLHGVDADPEKTQVVFNLTGPRNGGTFNSGTISVESTDDHIDHLTISNDAGSGKGQAVVLAVTGDRAVFRNVRILGAQDTLFAASQYCYGDYGPCVGARQYFRDCYVAGNVDFIFGDSTAVFDHCELHGIAGRVMYTAQSRHTAEQKSAYVLDHCHLTADPHSQAVTLGRPWRPYATVVYLHTRMDAPVIPSGWTEWPRFGVPSLPLAYYAEFDSSGPGADAKAREAHAHQLTASEAIQWSPNKVLAGKDGWNPVRGK